MESIVPAGTDKQDDEGPQQHCETARQAALEATMTPQHERGFLLSALLNHLRECDTCKEGRG